MRRALTLRTKGKPFLVTSRLIPPSRSPQHLSSLVGYRPRSTLQESTSSGSNELVSAILHGALKDNKGSRSLASNPPQRARQIQKKIQAGMSKGVAGQKRKAPEPLPQPKPRRRRRDPPTTTRKQYLQSSSQEGLPTADEYPHLPSQLFEHPTAWLKDALDATHKIRWMMLRPDKNGNHCQLTCTSKDSEESIVTIGHAPTKTGAEKAAALHMIVKFKDSEDLKTGVAHLRVDKLDPTTLEDEKDAKLDMYNYAARFHTTPEISVKHLARSKGARSPKVCEVTIKLLEQGIEVVGRSPSEKVAESAAVLRFKEAAEKYQLQHGDQSLVIRDSTAVTTDNSSKFFDYYKIIHPDATVKLVEPETQGQSRELLIRRGIHQTQVSLNDKPIGHSVVTTSRKKAEGLAYLTAALEVIKQEPEILPGFFRALATGNGEILKPVPPVEMSVDEDCQLVMRETLLGARKAGLPDKVDEMLTDEGETTSRTRAFRRRLSPIQIEERDQELERAFSEFLIDPRYGELRKKKEELPMNQYRDKVLDLVSNNSYSIIVGATGSGKTTQVPQIIMEDAITAGSGASCNVICTQPRRIAATSVARRVAEERAQQLQDMVGYHVRFDAKLPKHGGSITYCTTGILLQQLQHSPDEVMDGISHLVIDEVHERDIMIDFLLIILKRVKAERAAAGKTTPKVVLMSATMDTELFANYFQSQVQGQGKVACPSLSVPGRTFPVREKHLEEISKEIQKAHGGMAVGLLQNDPATTDFFRAENNYQKQNPLLDQTSTHKATQAGEFVIDWKNERKLNSMGEATVSTEKEDAIIPFGLVATTIAHISKTTNAGAILVFLPGLEEMVKVEDLLKKHPLGVDFRDASKFRVHLLHSSLPAAQTEVFKEAPEGCRKIILSTNIAETSITIPDVQYVVDTGKLREKQYDQVRRITQLKCTWISKSNSKQRAGRAGRVQNGNYYALFSAERYNKLRAVGLPEMLRSDLQDICLDVKAQAFSSDSIRHFLSEALEPPAPKNVEASIMNLQALDALTDDEQITPLGRLLASLPVHPSLGKMIILGIIFRCLDPMLILGAAAAERNIFINPLENRRAAYDAKTNFVRGSGSDHIALLNAVYELRQIRDNKGEYAMKSFGFENFIHINGFKTIDSTARQIEEILVEAGLIPYTPAHMRQRSEFGDPSLNENSSKVPLIKALAISGLHPNLATTTGGVTHRTPGEANTLIHPSSVNYWAPKRKVNDIADGGKQAAQRGTLFAYSTMAKSNDGNTVYLRDTMECTPLMAALFGGRLARRKNNILEMDDWLPFYVTSNDKRASYAQTAKTVLELRKALERLLAVAFMDLKGSREKVRAAMGKPGGSRGAFLADEKVRALFAEGLVEILDRDVEVREEIARRGWKGLGVGTGGKKWGSAVEGKY